MEAGSGAGGVRQPRAQQLGRAWLGVEWDQQEITMAGGAMEALLSRAEEQETGEVPGAEEVGAEDRDSKVEPSKGEVTAAPGETKVPIVFSFSSKTCL